MKKSIIMAITALLVLSVVAAGASAFNGGWKNKNINDETKEEIKVALANEDYTSFVEIVSANNPERAEKITEERFEHMVERFQEREAVHDAIESGDYEAWVDAVEAASRPKVLDTITEENFDTFQELHEARQNGDKETAKALAEELGLDHFGKGHGRMGHGKGGHGRGMGHGDRGVEI